MIVSALCKHSPLSSSSAEERYTSKTFGFADAENDESDVKCWDSDKQIQILQQVFIGPQAQHCDKAMEMIKEIVQESFQWRRQQARKFDKPCEKTSQPSSVSKQVQREIDELNNKMESKVRFVIEKMKDEIPSFSTNFLSHMLNDNTLPSIYGNIISLMQNPNVCTHQLSRVAKHFEEEGIMDISEMLGFRKGSSYGHFTADGTLANFESVVRARARCYDWIAMGCMAKKYNLPLSEKEKKFCSTLFNIGHMGWELHDKISELFDEFVSENGHSKYELLQPYMLEFDLIQAAFNITQLFEKKEFFQSPIMIVPNNKHYSWPKSHVFGVDFNQFWYVDIDEDGRMKTEHLKELVYKARQVDRPIFMIVSVFGSTECGNFDKLDEITDLIQELRRKEAIDLYLHCDGAYGGFMLSTLRACQDDEAALDFESYMNYAECILGRDLIKRLLAVRHANSITIDPHKLGYAPYACGAYIQREEREYFYRKCDAPYISFQGRERGTVSLEGSRAVGGVLGTWLSSKVIGFNFKGLGSIILHSIKTKQYFVEKLLKIPHIYILNGDCNIVCFVIAKKGELLSQTNMRITKLFQYFSPENFDAEYYASTTSFKSSSMVEQAVKMWNGEFEGDSHPEGNCLKVLRMVFMNPFTNTPAAGYEHVNRLISLIQNMVNKEIQ
ncbi:tentative decarboxylase [Naegleria gruberi]|uniref:Tentative decarboxylase n=1 Tax=Naegleria gruberi TaxID=5762 RepID=D2VF83_NAEGR|nr:tentative decarboxylase [Naegleria gruberi]EFC44415.1 tentative decarboxylase [Naegleria gruberi]|eukprot:XP_002677159.1 tentative decarboxylase [Naegleria gruberi strain NEG-M]